MPFVTHQASGRGLRALGNESSGCARRRRSGARCWLDQELVRLAGVTHHRPAARFPCSRPAYRTLRVGGSVEDARRRAGLHGRCRPAPRLARARGRRRATGALIEATTAAATGAATRRRCGSRNDTRRAHVRWRSRAPATSVPASARSCSATASRCTRSSDKPRRAALRGKDDRSTLSVRPAPRSTKQRATPRARAAPGGAAAAVARTAERRRRATRRSRPAAQRDRHRSGPAPQPAAAAAATSAQGCSASAARTHTRPTSSPPSSSCAHSPAASRPRPRRMTTLEREILTHVARSHPSSSTSLASARRRRTAVVSWSHHGRIARKPPSPGSPARTVPPPAA